MSFRPTCGRCGEESAASATRCEACNAPLYPAKRKSRAKPKAPKWNGRPKGERRQILNHASRAKYGCLTTWEHPDGRTLTIHRLGPPLQALREAAALALGEDESLRLVAYSTPETIYTDLIGGRADALQPARGFKATWDKSVPKPLPEQVVHGQVKLAHLLHPRLKRMTKRDRVTRAAQGHDVA